MRRCLATTGVLSLILASSAFAVVSNGFDSDYVYVLEGGANAPTNKLYKHLKANPVITADPWISVNAPTGTATSGAFSGVFLTSLTFSNSGKAGAHTPSGFRLFYLGKSNAVNTGNNPGFPIIVEVDSSTPPVKLREFYVGRAVNGNADFGAATFVNSFPLVNLRYNAKNNTLMVGVSHDGIGTGGVAHIYIYELSLPDSPVGTGVGSPDELQGVTLMETYDTGITGADAVQFNPPTSGTQTGGGGVNLNVSPDGTLYFRNQITDVFTFPSTAGGYTPGGTTSGPTTPPGLTNVALNAKTATLGLAQIGAEGQWQSVLYRPANNSLVNLQRKTGAGSPVPVILGYDVSTQALSLIGGTGTASNPGTSTDAMRGQHNECLDTGTGDIWIAGQSLPGSGNGGTWKYDAGGTLTKWDTQVGGLSVFDVAVPPSGTGACCMPAFSGGGCTLWDQIVCVNEFHGGWNGPGSTCAASSCDTTGACCLPGGQGCTAMTQGDCAFADGFWQGVGTTCGQFPCPLGACCAACGFCNQTLPGECSTSATRFWGPGSTCGQVTCPSNLCAEPPVDGDCDGDIDMDDFGIFQRCYNPGGAIPAVPVNCACFDRAAPFGQIDHDDFTAFVNCAIGSGSGVPAFSPCP